MTTSSCERAELDLRHRDAVEDFFREERPDVVFLAAAKVGGIYANDTLPADFIRDNLQIETNVIDAAYHARVRKLLFLGSSCIYPKHAAQPIDEAALLSGPLEPTNQWYAIAKIAGIMLCQAYAKQHGFEAISLMPTNLYGPGDNFHALNAHVLPALLRRFHEAKERGLSEVVVWGTGNPRREFLHVDDLADAALHLMAHYRDPDIVNVGTGTDVSIRELVRLIMDVVGYDGIVRFDAGKPDGTPRKVLNCNKLRKLGWSAHIPLATGLRQTYDWFLKNQIQLRGMQAMQVAH